MAKNKKLRKGTVRAEPKAAAVVVVVPVKVKGPSHTPKKPKVAKTRYARPPRVEVPEKPAVAAAPKSIKRSAKILAGAAASLIVPPEDDPPTGLPKWSGIR